MLKISQKDNLWRIRTAIDRVNTIIAILEDETAVDLLEDLRNELIKIKRDLEMKGLIQP